MTTLLKKNRWLWLRFRLRTLLFLFAIVCVLIGSVVISARRQTEAVRAITKAGGSVYFDYQQKLVPVPGQPGLFRNDPDPQPGGPAWLRKLIGDDFFCNVIRASFGNSVISDADLWQLAKLPSLEQVHFTNTQVRKKVGNNP